MVSRSVGFRPIRTAAVLTFASLRHAPLRGLAFAHRSTAVVDRHGRSSQSEEYSTYRSSAVGDALQRCGPQGCASCCCACANATTAARCGRGCGTGPVRLEQARRALWDTLVGSYRNCGSTLSAAAQLRHAACSKPVAFTDRVVCCVLRVACCVPCAAEVFGTLVAVYAIAALRQKIHFLPLCCAAHGLIGQSQSLPLVRVRSLALPLHALRPPVSERRLSLLLVE